MKKGVVFILCGLGLLAQPPAPERFWWGKVVSIESRPELSQYKYMVWNGRMMRSLALARHLFEYG